MKTYIVTTDAKNPDMYSNTFETFHINAKNYKDAQKVARRLCRHENVVLVSVRVRK